MKIELAPSEVERAVEDYVRRICVLGTRSISVSIDDAATATVEIGDARIVQARAEHEHEHEHEAMPTWNER